MPRIPDLPPDLVETVAQLGQPDLPPPRAAAARKRLLATCGPTGELLIQACTQAAVARRQAAQAQADLAALRDGPQLLGTVIGLGDGRVHVQLGPMDRLLVQPPELALRIGDPVLTDAEGSVILGRGTPRPAGSSYVFCERLEGSHALVRPQRDGALGDARQLAVLADDMDPGSLVAGDVVLGYAVDSGNLVLVTRRLGPARPLVAPDVRPPARVRREDIVGLDEQIAELDLLLLHSDEPGFRAILDAVNPGLVGRLLEGPPGCGKTKVGQLLLATVAARGGKTLYRTGSYYLDKFVGHGAALLRTDFAVLDEAYHASGIRSLLVIDEIEAIAQSRALPAAQHGGFLDVLDELLGLLTRSSVRVVGISNVARRLIDPALLREGRLQVLRFPPTLDAAQVSTLVERILAGVALADGDARAFGDTVSDLVFAPTGPLARLLRVQLADGQELTFGARDLATGAAVLDGVVRPALARWVGPDLRAGRGRPRPFPLDVLRAATLRHFQERAAIVTTHNAREVLPDRLPEGLAVVRVERDASPHAVAA